VNADFYRSFEDRHRGGRDVIKRRLTVYRPFLEPLLGDATAQALDLGCGRGEWLELLREWGLPGRGVDRDEGMLGACSAAALQVERGDALAALQASASDSLAVVSAFHLVEHLAFPDVYALVAEAKRVLRPGGLLIMETPNPENLIVGASAFYLDPTHQRPLPPDLLAFLPAQAAFARIKTLRLQERPGLLAQPVINLGHVLRDVSPDYAVVGQKDGDPQTLASFDRAFTASYGVTLDELIERFDADTAGHRRQIEARLDRLEAELAAVYRSRSWRLTRPLRALTAQIRRLRGRETAAR
jgi:SAM-dependent methyltransferase